MSINLKHCAHIGDAVWELFVREFVINYAKTQRQLHQMSVKFVNANFQAKLMAHLGEHLTPDELEIARRGRNLPLGTTKKSNPQVHAIATSFEVLVGYLHLYEKNRLEFIFQKACLFFKENL